jgi:Sec-independent protein translocase protein TatA
LPELLLITLIVRFGPGKAGQTARDLGKFAYQARGSIEEFKAEVTATGSLASQVKEDEQQEPTEDHIGASIIRDPWEALSRELRITGILGSSFFGRADEPRLDTR